MHRKYSKTYVLERFNSGFLEYRDVHEKTNQFVVTDIFARYNDGSIDPKKALSIRIGDRLYPEIPLYLLDIRNLPARIRDLETRIGVLESKIISISPPVQNDPWFTILQQELVELRLGATQYHVTDETNPKLEITFQGLCFENRY
jgi:hypothetical protein